MQQRGWSTLLPGFDDAEASADSLRVRMVFPAQPARYAAHSGEMSHSSCAKGGGSGDCAWMFVAASGPQRIDAVLQWVSSQSPCAGHCFERSQPAANWWPLAQRPRVLAAGADTFVVHESPRCCESRGPSFRRRRRTRLRAVGPAVAVAGLAAVETSSSSRAPLLNRCRQIPVTRAHIVLSDS